MRAFWLFCIISNMNLIDWFLMNWLLYLTQTGGEWASCLLVII